MKPKDEIMETFLYLCRALTEGSMLHIPWPIQFNIFSRFVFPLVLNSSPQQSILASSQVANFWYVKNPIKLHLHDVTINF